MTCSDATTIASHPSRQRVLLTGPANAIQVVGLIALFGDQQLVGTEGVVRVLETMIEWSWGTKDARDYGNAVWRDFQK